MRVFEPEPELKGYRLNKIGIRNHMLYVSPNRTDAIQIWCLHAFIPNSWRCITDFRLNNLLYSSYTLSPTQEIVYILAVALFDCDVPRISILQINTDNGKVKCYNLDVAAGDEFENKVFLENVVIGCDGKLLYMYDRSIVMGAIPFWEITLLEDTMTFIITNNTIAAEESESACSRFPVVLNGDERKVLKIKDDHTILVYNNENDQWEEYIPSYDSNLDLSELTTRGVSESYGRSGHRMGAVESPLSIFTGSGSCIAKVYRNGLHSFYNIKLDDDSRQYRILPASCCKLPNYIQQKFYAACSEAQFVFICEKGIAFVPMCPCSLRELAFFAIQQQYSSNQDGRWSGGISEQNLKNILSCKSKTSIV
uniref:CNH domain-containing protein n=1 Tax=Syphacia muris TaxID=451379 RepID=A0A0N5AE03_9BILA